MSTPDNNLQMTPHPIDQYLQHLTNIGHPRTTTRTYGTVLRRVEAELPAGLRAYDHELEAWLGRHQHPSTRNTYRAALQGFYGWAVKKKLIDSNPSTELEPARRPRGVPRPASLAQLSLILERAEEPVRLWALCAAYAGARCIEISRLDRGDINEESTYLYGKGGRHRAVPTHPQLWAAVRNLPPGSLAGGRSPTRISTRAAGVFDAIGVPDVTMHRLRHLAGTLWQRATGDIRVTQQLLGHSSPATTAIYTEVAGDALRRAVLAFPDVTSGDAGSSVDGQRRPS